MHVEMRAGRGARAADAADELALLHARALRRRDRRFARELTERVADVEDVGGVERAEVLWHGAGAKVREEDDALSVVGDDVDVIARLQNRLRLGCAARVRDVVLAVDGRLEAFGGVAPARDDVAVDRREHRCVVDDVILVLRIGGVRGEAAFHGRPALSVPAAADEVARGGGAVIARDAPVGVGGEIDLARHERIRLDIQRLTDRAGRAFAFVRGCAADRAADENNTAETQHRASEEVHGARYSKRYAMCKCAEL
jgi:hypothetical protein